MNGAFVGHWKYWKNPAREIESELLMVMLETQGGDAFRPVATIVETYLL